MEVSSQHYWCNCEIAVVQRQEGFEFVARSQ